MIVYQIIKDCSISYTANGENNGFALYKGDYFFIEPDACWVRNVRNFDHDPSYIKKSVLVKIYYNKLTCFGDKPEDMVHEWTWVDNINIADPEINNKITSKYFSKINPYYGGAFCIDVTDQWERDSKLESVLQNHVE